MKVKVFPWLLGLALVPARLNAAEMALQVLHEFFPGSGPSYTFGSLLEEADGSFLSSSRNGGTFFDSGTVYRITRNGSVTLLYSFEDSPLYERPYGLSRMADGNLCGIVQGVQGSGLDPTTIFKLQTNDWTLSIMGTTSDSFSAWPTFDGIRDFYGVQMGGEPFGGVLRISTNGSSAWLCIFTMTNGASPTSLILSKDGLLYGTTETWAHGYGTVFKATTNGVLTTLAYFDHDNGASPSSPLIFGSDQRLYGTTRSGGTNGGHGTVFRVSTNGVLESLWSFDGTNGGRPALGSGLVQALNGKFYGITAWGTSSTNSRYGQVGTVFSITTNGEFSVVARFNGTNIVNPTGNMILAQDGNIYGVAADEYVYPSMNGNTGIFFRLAQVPGFTSVIHTNGVTRLEWTSFTNGVYQIESRTTLNPTNWTTVSSNLTAPGNSLSFTLPPSAVPQNFYRVRLLP